MSQSESGCSCAPEGVGKVIALVIVAFYLLGTADVCAQIGKDAPKTGAASAGEYLEMTPDPPAMRGWSRAMRNDISGTPKQVLLGNEPLALNQAQFDKFFESQLFPQFTIYKVDPSNPNKTQTNVLVIDAADEKDEFNQRSRLPKMREDFVKQFLNQGHDQGAFEHMEDLAVKSMSQIALGNYHPWSRYNAVMLLASLHEFNKLEQPYHSTWKVFADCLDSIGPVKIAAMYAILRHAKAGIPAAEQARMLEKLDKILNDKNLAKGEDREGHDWIRRKAIDVLTAMGETAFTPKVVADLAAIVNDPQSWVELSCAAAKALGSIPSSTLAALNLSTLADNIGRVALVATRDELARAEARAFAAPLPILNGGTRNSGPAFQRAAPGAAPETTDAAPAAPVEQFISLALLKRELTELEDGIKGPGGGLTAAAAGTAHAETVARVEGALTALIATCDDKVASYATLKQQIEKGADALEGKLGKAAGSAAAPAAGKSAGGGADAFGDLDKAPSAARNAQPAAGK